MHGKFSTFTKLAKWEIYSEYLESATQKNINSQIKPATLLLIACGRNEFRMQ